MKQSAIPVIWSSYTSGSGNDSAECGVVELADLAKRDTPRPVDPVDAQPRPSNSQNDDDERGIRMEKARHRRLGPGKITMCVFAAR
jgi:hypothetical protein